MLKVKVKTKDSRLCVRAKLTFDEYVDTAALDGFSRRMLRGFLTPKLVKPRVLEYTGPTGISLFQKLQSPISKYEFFFIAEQVVEAVQRLQKYGFTINYTVWDPVNAFINEATKELQLMYLPTAAQAMRGSAAQFLESMIYQTKPAVGRDMDFASRFLYFIRNMRTFDCNALEHYIASEEPQVMNVIKNKAVTVGSGYLTDKQKDYVKHYEDEATGLLREEELYHEDEATGLLQDEQQYYEDEATGLLREEELYHEDEATGLLREEELYHEDEATGLLREEELYHEDEATGLLREEELYHEDEATGLLNDNGGFGYSGYDPDTEATGLLTDDSPYSGGVSDRYQAPNRHFPKLVRVSTNETILVDKPVFRIGKEKSFVDYFVSNNSAVSRSHADIITRGNRCFVVDQNSKNKTYIDGQRLPIMQECEIFDGSRLMLADEEFIFYQ